LSGFREFKDTGGKIIPENLLPLTLAVDTLVVSTAARERGFSQLNVVMDTTRSWLSIAAGVLTAIHQNKRPTINSF